MSDNARINEARSSAIHRKGMEPQRFQREINRPSSFYHWSLAPCRAVMRSVAAALWRPWGPFFLGFLGWSSCCFLTRCCGWLMNQCSISPRKLYKPGKKIPVNLFPYKPPNKINHVCVAKAFARFARRGLAVQRSGATLQELFPGLGDPNGTVEWGLWILWWCLVVEKALLKSLFRDLFISELLKEILASI